MPDQEFSLPGSMTLDAEVVPEPGTLFSLGLGLLVGGRRLRVPAPWERRGRPRAEVLGPG